MTNTAEHLEHVEHAQHHAANPFDRLVAITMAIVAAVLASVTLLSHRSHTDTLRLQSESNILQTKASDQWSYFQAKNIRQHEYTALISLLDAAAKEPGKEAAAKKSKEEWSKIVKTYKETDLPDMKAKAEAMEKEAKLRQEESHLYHTRADRFDLGELCVELALVLCSLALLTKRPAFWYSGMVTGLLGLTVALTAYTLSVEVHESPGAEATEGAPH